MNKFAYDLPKDLYKGMSIRPTMDMIVNSIEKDPFKIKYPDRDAAFYLNSPQFLNVLTEGGLGMSEQSKNLAERRLKEAQARAEGRGGAVDMAVDDTISTVGDDDYAERVRVADMQEQERRRQEEAARLAEQIAAQRRVREEQERRAAALAAAAASSSTVHPTAAAAAAAASNRAAAAAYVSLLTGTRNPVYAPTPDNPFATQRFDVLPSSAANIIYVPRPANEAGMSSGSQQKRVIEGEGDGTSPKAKARSDVQSPTAAGATTSTRRGRTRGASVPPKMKHEEAEAAARALIQDQALRSDKPYLKTLDTPVLRALLQMERVTAFLGSKGKIVNTSSASKGDLIDEIARHFGKVDETLQRIQQLSPTGAASSSAAPVAGLVVIEEKKEKKTKKEKIAIPVLAEPGKKKKK